jgi:hypothetical protein
MANLYSDIKNIQCLNFYSRDDNKRVIVLSQAPRHKDVCGHGGVPPRIVKLGK